MNKYNSIPKFLLVDEVHGVGSSEYQKGFTEVVYNYYLGFAAFNSLEDIYIQQIEHIENIPNFFKYIT